MEYAIFGLSMMWLVWLIYFFNYHMSLAKLLQELSAEVDRLSDEVDGIYEMMWESGIGEKEE